MDPSIKVKDWLQNVYEPRPKERCVPGEEIKYTMSLPYLGTVSESLSNYSSINDTTEEQRRRETTRQAIKNYREELDDRTVTAQMLAEFKLAESHTIALPEAISVDLSPVRLRPSPLTYNSSSPQKPKKSAGPKAPRSVDHHLLHQQKSPRNYKKAVERNDVINNSSRNNDFPGNYHHITPQFNNCYHVNCQCPAYHPQTYYNSAMGCNNYYYHGYHHSPPPPPPLPMRHHYRSINRQVQIPMQYAQQYPTANNPYYTSTSNNQLARSKTVIRHSLYN